jgi:hypothetical protein
MDRRTFIKVTALTGAGLATQAVLIGGGRESVFPATQSSRPSQVAAPALGKQLVIDQAGTYRISGLVRLEAPSVEISGIANTQSLSWAGLDHSDLAVSRFVSFEEFDKPGLLPNIQVRGGRLESLTAVLID